MFLWNQERTLKSLKWFLSQFNWRSLPPSSLEVEPQLKYIRKKVPHKVWINILKYRYNPLVSATTSLEPQLYLLKWNHGWKMLAHISFSWDGSGIILHYHLKWYLLKSNHSWNVGPWQYLLRWKWCNIPLPPVMISLEVEPQLECRSMTVSLEMEVM